MIPKKIQPYFERTRQTTDGDNNIIEGALTCCNAHDFEVLVVGKIKHTLFSKMFLCPENEKTVFKARCKKCGKIIPVFNSGCDGYGQCGKEFQSTCASPRPINCKKCQNEILSRLKNYAEDDLFNSTLDTCLSRAKISADDVWWNNLQMLKNEKVDTKPN